MRVSLDRKSYLGVVCQAGKPYETMVGWMHHTYDTQALLLHQGWQLKQPAVKGMRLSPRTGVAHRPLHKSRQSLDNVSSFDVGLLPALRYQTKERESLHRLKSSVPWPYRQKDLQHIANRIQESRPPSH
ncbi:Uncharacterized protein HZ326_25743 [Fusarium oxysporum f. sp. albedinis]|nr:Uncharacterized protein HZ326_25743 [Fusarium oxysporum f. sp. albedinis]